MLLSALLALSLQPDPASIRRLFEEALVRRRSQHGAEDPRTAQAARDLGLFLKAQNDLEGARVALAEAVRIDEKILGPTAPQTLVDSADLAAISPPAEAEPLWRRVAGSTDNGLASRALAALSEIRDAAGDHADATAFARRALTAEEALNKDGARVAVRLNALAALLEPREAIPLLQRALLINTRVLGPRHPETATTHANLAGHLVNTGRPADAIAQGTKALSIFEETLGIDHPRVATTCTVLAYSYRALKQFTRAGQLYQRALTIDAQAFGARHPETMSDAQNLAEFLEEIGKSREASDIRRRYGLGPPR